MTVSINKPDRARPDPVLAVQVDVDTLQNLRSYYGITAPALPQDEEEVVYRRALPRFAELFNATGVRATFFVVGQDLDHETNRDVVRKLHAAGHEIANHTQTHQYAFRALTREQKRDEIDRAGRAIELATGQKPAGFRAPGYDVDRHVLELLVELGYRYDSSVMPSLFGVPFKLIAAMLSQTGKVTGYGSAAMSLAPNRPYRPRLDAPWRKASDGSLWEIPVSCVPYLRLPFYANFNLFTGAAIFRLSSALAAQRHCNYVFHAVEMLDPSEVDPSLHRHPNLRRPLAEKISRCRAFIERLQHGRRQLLSRELAAELNAASLS